ncbi:hypothetical protein ACFFV8_16985 [Sphingobium indicum]|nr:MULTISPECIES: hypothetical protein [Sphingobium]MCB4861228.1 hypothetical protein [Sphingobium sp. PNB]UXC90705.1 hypothetical protein EGM87_17045 [Sphingobium sp. RSMS]
MTDSPLIKGAMIAPAQAFTVHITITPKGGAGKTEVANVLEAALSLSGHRPVLIDVDDGNRGLTRGIGKDHVVALNWASGPTDAPDWVRRYASGDAPMIFDLGAGLMSADLPILDFLSSVWRLLYNQGAKIVFHCIVSTNAPTSRFIGQILKDYGRIAEVLIVCNDQDRSASFPADITGRENRQLKLDHLAPGLQAVRLLRKAPLSALIAEPMQGYSIATKMIAARVYRFACQLAAASLLDPARLATLEAAAAGVPRLRYTIDQLADATDDRIGRNARLSKAHRRLVAADLNPSGLLSAAEDYRLAHAAWVERISAM